MIKVEHLHKSFGDFKALKDISLEINDGEIVSLIGPSGSGKSTLLRCIHGLEKAESGKIWLDGELMDPSKKEQYAAQRKKMGFVFQHFNLFNNKTVLENCMLAQTSVLGKSETEAQATAMEYLTKVGNRVVFLESGEIIEQNESEAFFSNPSSERAKDFLSKVFYD